MQERKFIRLILIQLNLFEADKFQFIDRTMLFQKRLYISILSPVQV